MLPFQSTWVHPRFLCGVRVAHQCYVLSYYVRVRRDLQLPMQSVPITTDVVGSTPARGEVYLIQHFVVKFVRDGRSVVFSGSSVYLHQ